LDYLDTPSGNYLVEEYIPGKDLKRVLDEHFSYLDPHLAARVLHQLAKGVSASHHAGVFHRDLKPSNIIVSDDPNLTVVKITDFGIAKMAEYEMVEGVDMNNQSSVTGSDTVLGALPYMAPEMITNAKEATTPADVWAVGAILYHLMTGTPPFGTGLQAIPGIVSGKLPPKPVLLTKTQFAPLGEELWSVVVSCLQPDASKRLTADQLISACAKLCYSDAPRSEGRIARFGFKRKAWGFIDRDGIDVFFHEESFYGGTPNAGAMVNFACFDGAPNSRAFPVLPLKVDSTL
jgi:serine/threonine-protein kinase